MFRIARPGVVRRYRDKFLIRSLTKVEEGRGLELYIAKEILEGKNWEILLVEKRAID